MERNEEQRDRAVVSGNHLIPGDKDKVAWASPATPLVPHNLYPFYVDLAKWGKSWISSEPFPWPRVTFLTLTPYNSSRKMPNLVHLGRI